MIMADDLRDIRITSAPLWVVFGAVGVGRFGAGGLDHFRNGPRAVIHGCYYCGFRNFTAVADVFARSGKIFVTSQDKHLLSQGELYTKIG